MPGNGAAAVGHPEQSPRQPPRRYRSSPTHPRVLGVALVAGFIGGCFIDLRQPPPQPVASGCRSDAQCRSGETCADGQCVRSLQGQALSVDLQFLPPASSGLVAQQIAGIDLASVSLQSGVELNGTKTLRGQVLIAGNPLNRGISARIEATRAGEIPGTTLKYEATTQFDPESGHVWRLELLAGTYDFFIAPLNSPQIPPARLSGVDIRVDQPIEIQLPNPALLTKVIGTVVQLPDSPTAVADAQVVAFSARDPVMTSTVAVTNQQGEFSVVLPAVPGPFTLRIGPSRTRPALPVIERTGIVAPAGAARIIDMGTILTGLVNLASVPVSGRVTGISATGLTAPVTPAIVEFSGAMGLGTFSAAATTGSDGSYRVHLPPGPFVARVTPPPGNEFGAQRETLVVSGPASRDFSLRQRPSLSGVVTAPTGQTVAGVRVEALRRAAASGEETSALVYELSAQTDVAGRYLLLLDPGSYQLSYVPPAASGLPRWTVDQYFVGESGDQRDVQLLRAAGLTGIILGPDRRPAKGVVVEAFWTQPRGGREPRATPPKPVGSGVTDETGRFGIILPDLSAY